MPTDNIFDLSGNPPLLDWRDIDTVLLDMDGTILDLNYDNYVWNEMVPDAFAKQHGLHLQDAKTKLLSHMQHIRGTMEFYCFEYWSNYCDIDLVHVHAQATHLISYRPGAEAFLDWLRDNGKKAVIATNAHRHSVDIKEASTGLCAQVDAVVSSHDFGYPKEDQRFWQALSNLHPHELERTLFVDDNEPVLDAAQHASIGHLLCVKTPDSNRPLRSNLRYPSFDSFEEIYPCPAPTHHHSK